MKKNYSIKDIAAELNISVTTVSFVLNGKANEKHISRETAQKVTDYAKRINYRANEIARCLRTGKSQILVFMVKDFSNAFFSKLAAIFEDLAYQNGYKVIFCCNSNKDDKMAELIDFYKLLYVDGFIVATSIEMKQKIQNLFKEDEKLILLDIDELNEDSPLFKIAEAIIGSVLKLIIV